jgi:hypothetical protein
VPGTAVLAAKAVPQNNARIAALALNHVNFIISLSSSLNYLINVVAFGMQAALDQNRARAFVGNKIQG